MKAQDYFIAKAFLPTGWARDVRLRVTGQGLIANLRAGAIAEPGDRRLGTVLPGITNAHSHAFQRAMAGMSEYRMSPTDSFWSWRKTMYQYANRVSPQDLHAIAAHLFVEMLKGGYTSVAEFHYLHHQPDGTRYPNRSQLSQSIIDAANLSGINLTLLPVLYMTSGFGGAALVDAQRRFGNSLDDYFKLHAEASDYCADQPQHCVGMALHSLRAVTPQAIDQALGRFIQAHPQRPIHIHVAEQLREVEQSLATLGQRPVEWLLNNHKIDSNWCLIHATHMTMEETIALAATGATVGICPTTEANLGDGLFPLDDYLRAGGSIAIGSDGNSAIDPFEEMRWLEYGQRLATGRRNVAAGNDDLHTGSHLYRNCAVGGGRAINAPTGAIADGYRADLLVVDDRSAERADLEPRYLLDNLLFSPSERPIADVMVNGKWRIQAGHHHDEELIAANFAKALRVLRSA